MILPLVLLALASTESRAQRQAWNWYFGDKVGLTFRNGIGEPLADGQLQTNEGSSSMSDPATGSLLFYTDGVKVYNRLHEVMLNGTGLNGDPSTSQSAIIVPAPGSSSLYYIFNPAPVTSTALNGRCYCLYYSVVDMRGGDGYGEVVTKNQHLYDDVTEHIAAVADCKNEGWWIVVRSRKTRHFFSFHVERGRVNPLPTISDAGNPLLVVENAGNMHISPDGRKLVITSISGNSQLYDFDVSTGKVLNAVSLFPPSNLGAHYGAAFSRDGRRVYIAVSVSSGFVPTRIYQFNAAASTAIEIQNSIAVVGLLPNNNEWTPMQLGPDGRIYIGRPKQPYLAMISDAEKSADSIRFQDSVINLGNLCRNGLPTFVANYLGTGSVTSVYCQSPEAGFATDSGCVGTCLTFPDQSVGRVDTYEWVFEGATPRTSDRKDPGLICYPAAGVFAVRLVVRNPFGEDTATAIVNIRPRPDVEVDSVLEICPGQSVRLNAQGATSYRWEPSRTLDNPSSPTPVATPTSTTRYTVIGAGANTCMDTATVLVRVRALGGGTDKTMCIGGEVILDGFGADSYAWTPTTGLSDATAPRPLARPLQTTTYYVRLRAGICEVEDTVVVNVVDTFSVTIAGAIETCAGIGVPVTVSGGSFHRWWPTLGVADTTSSSTVIRPLITTTYFVEARSGDCIDTASITITVVEGVQISAGNDASSCEGSPVFLLATLSGTGVNGTRVAWTPSAGLDKDTGLSVIALPTQNTEYIVKAVDPNGCISYDTVLVDVKSTPSISAGQDIGICSGGSIQLFVSGDADEYSWLPVSGLNDPTSPAPVASPGVSTTYIVTGRTGSCTVSDTIRVDVSSLNLKLSSDTSICIGSEVTLVAEGASRYEWSPVDGLSDPTIATPVASPSVTTTYLVRGTDAFGCESVKIVRIGILDALPLTLIAESASAQAGTENLGIPVYVEVDEALLPLHVDTLFAELLTDVSVFMPSSVDRGTYTSSLPIGSSDRVTRIRLTDVRIVSPRQKITEVRGLVLAGNVQVASLRWGRVSWKHLICPVTSTEGGFLFVSGCNLASRVVRQFSTAALTMHVLPEDNAIVLDIVGNEPGPYNMRIVGVDGRIVLDESVATGINELDMSGVGAGLYFVMFSTPIRTETVPLSWLR
ncbi:MAG: hypothetical protein SGJ05_08550 [bacterium]|nr:hypothetical protein [bacterium]